MNREETVEFIRATLDRLGFPDGDEIAEQMVDSIERKTDPWGFRPVSFEPEYRAGAIRVTFPLDGGRMTVGRQLVPPRSPEANPTGTADRLGFSDA